jgi:hypothetical protein
MGAQHAPGSGPSGVGIAALVSASPGHGDGSLWIVVLAVVILAPILVGLIWRLVDRRRDR